MPKPLLVWISTNCGKFWKRWEYQTTWPAYAGQEATVRTGHGTTDWFQIRKGVHQGCILSPCLFNLYAEYIMRNVGLDEAQAGIKIPANAEVVKNSPANKGGIRDAGSIPGLGRSPREGKSYPLQYSGLENSLGCRVHGVAKSQTWLSNFHFHSTLSPSSKGSLVPLHFLPLKRYHLHIWDCWYFSWDSWFQLVNHPVWHFTWCTLHIS